MAEKRKNCFKKVVAGEVVRDDVLVNPAQELGSNTESCAQTMTADLNGDLMYGFPIFSPEYDNSFLADEDDEWEEEEKNSFYAGGANHRRNPKKDCYEVSKREQRRMATERYKRNMVRRISERYKNEARVIEAEVDEQNVESTDSKNSCFSEFFLIDEEEEDSEGETKNNVARVNVMDSKESTIFSRLKCWKYYPRARYFDSRTGDHNAGIRRKERRRLLSEFNRLKLEFLGNR